MNRTTTIAGTQRIACACSICCTNAATVGLPTPLRADVPRGWDATNARLVHGWVHLANDPILGESASNRILGIRAVTS